MTAEHEAEVTRSLCLCGKEVKDRQEVGLAQKTVAHLNNSLAPVLMDRPLKGSKTFQKRITPGDGAQMHEPQGTISTQATTLTSCF